MLFACSSQVSQPPTSVSSTPRASATVAATPTKPKPTQTPTKILLPTLTPYPTKEVIFNYTHHGLVGLPFENLFLDKVYSTLVLYSDGQMIRTGAKFEQKLLTKEEMDQFLLTLETLGFYKIESNQQHDPTDQLYDFGGNYAIEDIGVWYCVTITRNPRTLCAYEPYRKFLVPEMKNILSFLDEYKPEGMSPYQPDRILLRIEAGRNPDVPSLPEKALPWSESFPSLRSATNGTLYADGKAASEIFSLLGEKLTPNVVTQNGEEYTIKYVRPVLPHEVVSFP